MTPKLKDAASRNAVHDYLKQLTIIKPNKINNIVTKFVINNLPTISGYTYDGSLNKMIQAIYANTTTLPKIWQARNTAMLN